MPKKKPERKPPAKRKTLSQKELAFCYEYIANRFNGSKAAIAAGYGEKTARVTACQLLSKDLVKSKVADLTEKYLNSVGVKATDVIRELAVCGFSDIADYFQTGQFGETDLDLSNIGIASKAIKTIKVRFNPLTAEQTTEFTLHDKLKSLELIGKNQQMFTDKIDLTSGGQKVEQAVIILPDNGKSARS